MLITQHWLIRILVGWVAITSINSRPGQPIVLITLIAAFAFCFVLERITPG